ncbi:MAG: C2H2-type zinc finger protein [Candidatus Thorarchaeota archaeon]
MKDTKEFKCKHCTAVFYTPDEWERHIRDKHPDKVEMM